MILERGGGPLRPVELATVHALTWLGVACGIGLLLPFGSDAEKDTMIATIGPFWDANETWLVLGVGILLVIAGVALITARVT